MKCPKCQFDNREDAEFCNECGNKFDVLCPNCGKTNRLGSIEMGNPAYRMN